MSNDDDDDDVENTSITMVKHSPGQSMEQGMQEQINKLQQRIERELGAGNDILMCVVMYSFPDGANPEDGGKLHFQTNVPDPATLYGLVMAMTKVIDTMKHDVINAARNNPDVEIVTDGKGPPTSKQ